MLGDGQGAGVDGDRIIELGPWLLVDDRGHRGRHRGRVGRPAGDGLLAGIESPAQNGGCGPVLGGQVDVAAGHGQTIGLPDDRAADHLDRHRQVGHHPTDDRQLLEVLLAEVGPARADDVEQLRDDGGDTGEMGRPGGAFPGG